MNNNNNNILVTGGAGYIGSHIVEELVKNKKNNVFIFDNLITGHKKLINKKATFIKGDIKNYKYLSICESIICSSKTCDKVNCINNNC